MLAIIFGVLGIVVGIVGAVISYFNIKEARRIAMLGGATKSPHLSLNYGALPLQSATTPIRTVVYGMPSGFKRKYIGVFRIIIRNDGKRAAENVKLEIVVPAGMNSGSEYLKFRPGKGVLPGVLRECFRINKLLHVYHYVPMINPGESISVEEPLWLETTVDVPLSTTVRTADKKTVKLDAIYTLSFVFDLVLFHKEELPLASQVEMLIVEEDDIHRLARRWVRIELEKLGDYPADRDKKTRKAWVNKRLEPKEVLLVIPAFNELRVPGKSSLQEDFDQSRRWSFTRTNGDWALQKQEWVFK